ncbi:hypothetical protein DBR06_SOUSAS2510063, partial [Sousa chinensis]
SLLIPHSVTKNGPWSWNSSLPT